MWEYSSQGIKWMNEAECVTGQVYLGHLHGNVSGPDHHNLLRPILRQEYKYSNNNNNKKVK